MAKLDRVQQKIFGETGGTDFFGQIGADQTGTETKTKNLVTIQALTQYLEGLSAITNSGSEPPRLEDFNSLFLLITTQLAYLFQEGIPDYNADTPYYVNSLAKESGRIYRSLTGTVGPPDNPNTGNLPSTSPAQWVDFLAEKAEALISGRGLQVDGHGRIVNSPHPAPDQDLRTTQGVTFATVDTGQGANELHPMDQAVRSTDDIAAGSIVTTDINTGTSDGSDNDRLDLSGGGPGGSSRGAVVTIAGNELPGIEGYVTLASGNVANSSILLFTNGDGAAQALRLSNAGGAQFGLPLLPTTTPTIVSGNLIGGASFVLPRGWYSVHGVGSGALLEKFNGSIWLGVSTTSSFGRGGAIQSNGSNARIRNSLGAPVSHTYWRY